VIIGSRACWCQYKHTQLEVIIATMFACSVQYFCGSATPPLQSGGASVLPNFGGFPYIYMYALCRRNTKFDAVTHMGNGLGFRGQPPLGPKGSEPQHCPISGVSSYLLVHSLKQNDQFGCGNTCGGRACFRQSSTPSIPRRHDRSVPHFCVFFTTYAYTRLDLEQPNSA